MMNDYNMTYEEAQEYISKRGMDIPWNDNDIVIDDRNIMQTVANVLKWADTNPNWISVEDKLPEVGEEVLFVSIFNKTAIKGYLTNDKKWWSVDHRLIYYYDTVTHWMTMPELPKR